MKKIFLLLGAVMIMAVSCETEDCCELTENQAPVAKLKSTKVYDGFSEYQFTAEGSTDAETIGIALFYKYELLTPNGGLKLIQDWELNGHSTNYTFIEDGNFTMKLSVMDPEGNSSSAEEKLTIKDGSLFTDMRDSQSYRIVRIGAKVWMAKNYNFYTASSTYYDNDSIANHGDGRFYSLDEAISICPEGWRVPTKADIELLALSAGGELLGAKKLKSEDRWTLFPGTNNFGLTLIPAGIRMMNNNGKYLHKDLFLALWMETGLWALSDENQEIGIQESPIYSTFTEMPVRYVRDLE